MVEHICVLQSIMTMLKGSLKAGIWFKRAGGIFDWVSFQLGTYVRAVSLNHILSHLKLIKVNQNPTAG